MIRLRNNQRSMLGWGLGLQWVVATTVSWVLIVLLFGVLNLGAVVRQAVSETVGFSVGFAVGGAIAGAVVGLAQWLVLRRQVSQAGWWVLASSLSLAVGFVIGINVILMALGWDVNQAVSFAIGGAIAGVVVGLAQWLVLRRQVSQAGWWVLASSLSLAVLFVVSDALGGNEAAFGRAVVAFVVAGVLAGAITGSALVRLLRQPLAKAEARG